MRLPIRNIINKYSTLKNNNKPFQIAIDGPSASGKSTIAKLVAKQLNLEYLDTGALYRAVTYHFYEKGILNNSTLDNITIKEKIEPNLIMITQDLINKLTSPSQDHLLRSPNITTKVSLLAQIPSIREFINQIQQEKIHSINSNFNGIIMEGRDIGSQIMPNANLKIFLKADLNIRAKRRWLNWKLENIIVELEKVKEDLKKRDEIDCNRKVAPLTLAKDAIVIDATNKSIEQVVELVVELAKLKMKDSQ